ncbi:hypothetical protein MKK75_01530 [Methylobacterium sp. J-030]|uniref:hypothetical protein n=1 Tax=Methylobacterium sp. J-030 TaxID=2836627 RepID=UPI001FBB726E|nr:hypothetical protein [Methylobacterium sp. J-030]MCJ2067497.1 hypothetical protein [Methylobacterium sp. J-030]
MSDNDDIYTLRRKRKHAEAQARSTAARKKRNAPSADDLNRAAYHAVLLIYRDPKTDQAVKDRLRGTMVGLLKRALFDRAETRAAFDTDAVAPRDRLNRWLARRWYEAGKHLGPEGKRYQPLTGEPDLSDQPLNRSNGGSAQGNGQPLIENGVTARLADDFADAF